MSNSTMWNTNFDQINRSFGYAFDQKRLKNTNFHSIHITSKIENLSRNQPFRLVPMEENNFLVLLNPDDERQIFEQTGMLYSNVGLYSVTCAQQSRVIASLLDKFFTYDDMKKLTLTDASACIGGNVWTFAKKVKKIFAIEIDDINFECLKYNTNRLLNEQDAKVELIRGSYLDYIDKLNQDVLFLDPPWGGTNEAKNELVYTHKGETINVDDLLRDHKISTKTDILILKLPKLNKCEDRNRVWRTIENQQNPYGFKHKFILRFMTIPQGRFVSRELYRLVVLSNRQLLYPSNGLTLPQVSHFNYKGIKTIAYAKI